MKVVTEYSELDEILKEDYGGESLYISCKEDLKLLKDNLKNCKGKFLDISNIDDIKKYLTINYGLVVIIGNDYELNKITDNIKDLDITIICLCKEFKNIEFVKNRVYVIFVVDFKLSNDNLYLCRLNLNILKFFNILDDLYNNKKYIKLDKINYLCKNRKVIIEDIIHNYKICRPSKIYNYISSQENSLNIFIVFIKSLELYLQENKVFNDVASIYVFAIINLINIDIENYINYIDSKVSCNYLKIDYISIILKALNIEY